MKRLATLLFVLSIVMVNVCSAQALPPNARPIVWYVHGFVSFQDKFEREISELREIYPNAERIELKRWNAPTFNPVQIRKAWNEPLENEEQAAASLANMIFDMSQEDRNRLVLIGHSLGAKIVIRAAARCQARKLTIYKIVLTGAAINNDDPDIAATMDVSIRPVDNIVNVNDSILGMYKFGNEFHAVLGGGYLYITDPRQFRELAVDGTIEHEGSVYLENYKVRLRTRNFANKNVIVPQDFSNAEFPTLGGPVTWTILDSRSGWLLQSNDITGHARILDPDGVRKAWGSKDVMQISFEKVKLQLNRAQPYKPQKPSAQDIDVIQDLDNIEAPVLDTEALWKDLDVYRGWRFQKHKITGHCRIIDDSDVRRAWGTEAKMRTSFEDVKQQIRHAGK